MNQEVAPHIDGYYYTGSNREGLSNRHAREGVGILIPEHLNRSVKKDMNIFQSLRKLLNKKVKRDT